MGIDVGMIWIVWLFALGAAIGSFLNVCIYRLPLDGSLLRPPSHCPQCKHLIRWRDNIPIVSFIILRGRCRDCRASISPRYLIVELLTATLFVLLPLVFMSRGEPLPCIIVYLALACALVVASFIDLQYTIIPNEITIPGMVVAVLASLAFPALHHLPSAGRYAHGLLANPHLNGLLHSFLGMAAGAAFILLMRVLGGLLFRKEAMGLGDVKFMGMVGGFLGWKLVTLTNFVAPVFGATVGVLLLLTKGEHKIPYGPFLSIATLAVIIFGPDMLLFIRMYYMPPYLYPG